MSKWIEAAMRRREVYDRQGAMLTDQQAAQVVEAYTEWKPGIDITPKMIEEGRNRYRVGKQLYRTEVPHVTIESWAPGLAVTVWTPIDIEHAGTLDDPIPAAVGMVYLMGLYYSEEEKVYLCIRQDTDMGTELHHMPSVLVGNYFEEVS